MRSFVQQHNISIFDRVTAVEFHRYSSAKGIDLSVFGELEEVSKPMEWVAIDTSHLNKLEASRKRVEELKRQAPIQAQAVLSHSFSQCQIAGIEEVNMIWRAEVQPDALSCHCSSLAK